MQGQGEDVLLHTHKKFLDPRKKPKKGVANEDRQRKFSQIGD